VRACLGFWEAEKASKAVLRCLKKGYELEFSSTPPPFKTAPLLVDDVDVTFALKDLAQGDAMGAYQPLLPGGADFLSRTRVHTQGGKRRTVHNYRRINMHVLKRTCWYEGVKDLH
jgi:hypothetical protein